MISRATKYVEKLRNLRGWRRNCAAYIFGICATLTLSPFYLFPLLIPAFSGLYILVDTATTRRRIAADGFFWGWGFFTTGLYWFCIALMTDDAFVWLIPFALFGLTAVIALFPTIACAAMFHVKKYTHGAGRIVAFALLFTLLEILRGHCFTGFPWNLVGYAFGFSTASLQLASIFGIYGLTFLAIIIGLSPLFATHNKRATFGIWAALACALMWGQFRIPSAPMPTMPEIHLRLIQANIAQPHKWDKKLQRQGMQTHIDLTNAPGIENITHVIWPETAVPYAIQPFSTLSRTLGESVPDGKILITGGLRTKGTNYANMQMWNSLMAISHNGQIIGLYDKAHLVPFGEFQPLRPYVPKDWMTPVGDKDFSWGTPSQTLSWDLLPPMLPLICYEAIFPEMAQSETIRPKWLLNVTNDAWFGTSTGPRQHFEMARMRAVEQGIPLVRVANTGISAVIDPYGRITAMLPLATQGFLDADLPQAIDQPTFYSQTHRVLLPLLAVALLVFALRRRR